MQTFLDYLNQYSSLINLVTGVFTAVSTSFVAWFFVIDKLIDKMLIWFGHCCRVIKIYPINKQGENIFFLNSKATDPTRLDKFFVKTHFNLWTKYQLRIINIDLEYKNDVFPISLNITINNHEEKTGASYRMLTPVNLQVAETANIFISRNFTCKYDGGADFGVITIKIEVASSLWSGIKEIVITGKLEPGGELKNIKLHISNNN